MLLNQGLMPPDTLPEGIEKEKQAWRTEYDVISTLKSLGHEVYPVGLRGDLAVIVKAREEHNPQIAFNLLEEFDGQALYDQHVVSYLELLKQSYTGCNPRGLTLAHDKALTKKILSYHRVAVPGFAVFPMAQKVMRPRRLKFPLLVKSMVEEGSVGISQASVVNDDAKLAERVEFIHRQTNSHAIAEQYIEGREIYVSVIGNRKLQTYTPWELVIENLPEGALRRWVNVVHAIRQTGVKRGGGTVVASDSPEVPPSYPFSGFQVFGTVWSMGCLIARRDATFVILKRNPITPFARPESRLRTHPDQDCPGVHGVVMALSFHTPSSCDICSSSVPLCRWLRAAIPTGHRLPLPRVQLPWSTACGFSTRAKPC